MIERRRTGRVASQGSVVIHSGAVVHARLVDLSTKGLRAHITGYGVPRVCVGGSVRTELRLDGSGRWFELDGQVVRVEHRAGGWDIVIGLAHIPLELETVVKAETLAARDCAETRPIVVVDNDPERRREVAATFRMAGCHVLEVGSPLEVLSTLDESRLHPVAIVISGAGEPDVDQLRRHLEETYPHVPSILLIDRRCFRIGRDLSPPELAMGARSHYA